jgi:N-acetylglucosamine-6-phosphate deacetylase|tara:strand:+ start:1371 stop:2525 length:1155 start_codon:yes stop_codon:yes gene_type:complete
MTKKKSFVGATIFDGFNRHLNSALIIMNGKVVEIIPEEKVDPSTDQIVLAGGLLTPGFVDLQVNGGGGVLFNDNPSLENLKTICEAHAKLGTTSIMPTLISDSPEVHKRAISVIIDALYYPIKGLVGLHLEGPHLAVARKGAHEERFIRPMKELDCLELESLANKVRNLMLTIAPEAVLPQQITRLSNAGAVISLGHTDCTFNQAADAVDAGATCATHLFNAMSPFGSREPGLVGAVLNSGKLFSGIIADGFHVNKISINLALQAKKAPGALFLVSDSMSTVGSEQTHFFLNDRLITRSQGKLILEDGALAGADISLSDAVRYMVNEVGILQDDAIRMASLIPAKVLGMESEIGCLMPDAQADFLWMKNDLEIEKVWVGGKEQS